jgi:hypothetical protein
MHSIHALFLFLATFLACDAGSRPAQKAAQTMVSGQEAPVPEMASLIRNATDGGDRICIIADARHLREARSAAALHLVLSFDPSAYSTDNAARVFARTRR